MSAPFVSVVMPVYNGARFVAEAVASVRAQDWPDLELIAVDDGSTDATPVALATLAADPANRMRVVRTVNRGPAAARNRALELARGPYVAFIDADDLWPAGKLAAQLGRLTQRPELAAVYGLVEIRDIEGFEGASRHFRNAGRPIIITNLGSAVFRAELFRRIGPFEETLRHGEDTDLMLRALEAGVPITVLNRVTLIYRHHDANLTHDPRGGERARMQVLARSLARRRVRGTTARELPKLSDFLETDEPAA